MTTERLRPSGRDVQIARAAKVRFPARLRSLAGLCTAQTGPIQSINNGIGGVACFQFFGHQVTLAYLAPGTRRGSDSRVPSPRVVEAFDGVEHTHPGIIPISVDLASCPSGLERRVETSRRSVVPDVTRPAH